MGSDKRYRVPTVYFTPYAIVKFNELEKVDKTSYKKQNMSQSRTRRIS